MLLIPARRLATPHPVVLLTALATIATIASVVPAWAQVRCDVSGDATRSGITATVIGETLAVEWEGASDERLRLRLGVVDRAPVITQLAIREGQSDWTTVLTDARLEFRIVEGRRRITNQQLAPLRSLGVELTEEIVDLHKWDAFWDAPLDLRESIPGGNPPPQEGVAGQPGLPRSPDEIRRSDAVYNVSECRVTGEGRQMVVVLPGMQLGSFSGEFVLTFHHGTNLIRAEAVASTTLPSVAYKYDVGLTGLALTSESRVTWRDVAHQLQSYALRGPVNNDHVVLRAANRMVVAETAHSAIAAFPPPHTCFWAREVEINVGNNWYRKDSDRSFSIGVRQGEQEVVERYLANWSLHSAPPGTKQRMAAYFYPTLGDHSDVFEAALAFTNGDVYRPLEGYQVMGSHYHTDMGRTLRASGSVDTRLSDFEVLRSAGITIAGPVDRPRDETQLEEQDWLFRGAERHSDDQFMVMPQMENSNLLGGHWDLLFSHPVYRSGPRNLDSGLSGISIVFQAAVPKPVVPKYTTSGVRRPSEL